MDSYFTINVSVANVYSKSDFDSSVLTQALLGESCLILDSLPKWVKIRQEDGYEGWLNQFYGIISNQPYDSNNICGDLNSIVYQNKDLTVPIRDLTFGNQLKTEKMKEGLRVFLPDGIQGWTSCKTRQVPNEINRKSLIILIRKFLGCQYLWGGKSPKGFDCSGLIQTVFNAFGILLPRDSKDQSNFFGSNIIDRNITEMGDLHFFGSKGKVSHIAITAENGKYIHCQGFVKEESFNKLDVNFNADLNTTHLHSVSIESILKSD